MFPRSDFFPQKKTDWIYFPARILAFLCLCFLVVHPSASAEEREINLDGTPVVPARKAYMAALGTGYAIGSDLGWQPQLGGYLDLPNSWQAGIKIRLAAQIARQAYDFFPHTSLDFRKLWLGEEGSDPIRNSEYFSFSLGVYPAYGFDGSKAGLQPLGSIALGKYWMPFDDRPFGIDLSLELSRFFSGHLLDRSQLVYVTTGLSAFYILP